MSKENYKRVLVFKYFEASHLKSLVKYLHQDIRPGDALRSYEVVDWILNMLLEYLYSLD